MYWGFGCLFLLWLLSLGITTLRFFHVVLYINGSFFSFRIVFYCMAMLDTSWSVYSPIDGHLSCPQFLTITNKGVTNISVINFV